MICRPLQVDDQGLTRRVAVEVRPGGLGVAKDGRVAGAIVEAVAGAPLSRMTLDDELVAVFSITVERDVVRVEVGIPEGVSVVDEPGYLGHVNDVVLATAQRAQNRFKCAGAGPAALRGRGS